MSSADEMDIDIEALDSSHPPSPEILERLRRIELSRLDSLDSECPKKPFHVWWSQREQSPEVDTSYVWYV